MQIAENMLKAVAQRLETLGVKLEIGEGALDILADKGFDPVYGARPLRRTIQSVIEDAIAEKVLDGSAKAGSTVVAEANEGKIELKVLENGAA